MNPFKSNNEGTTQHRMNYQGEPTNENPHNSSFTKPLAKLKKLEK